MSEAGAFGAGAMGDGIFEDGVGGNWLAAFTDDAVGAANESERLATAEWMQRFDLRRAKMFCWVAGAERMKSPKSYCMIFSGKNHT
jgi:hypothetical protein